MLPSQTEYIQVVKNLKMYISDGYIENAVPIEKKGVMKSLVSYSGGFSKVFPVYIGKKKLALRFWTRELKETRKRYKEIDNYLKVQKLHYFVNFDYIEEKFHWKQEMYSFISMDWVDGTPLDKYIDKYLYADNKRIEDLAELFLEMVRDLHSCQIAHGDLQEGNILVLERNGKTYLKLIDYDSLYVPALRGHTLEIHGIEAYQHPKKNQIKILNEKLDYFSELVIYLSIIAYAEDNSLRDANTEKRLLFTEKDFLNPDQSKIFNKLKKGKYSKEVQTLTHKLIEYCKIDDILKLKPLEDLFQLSFGDKELDKAYQNFVKVSKDKNINKVTSNTILDYLRNNKHKITAKGKVLKYLDFLNTKDKYVLPVDYNSLLSDKSFSLIDNIYSFYTIDEVNHMGKLILVDNLIVYAMDMTFSEQKQLQNVYHLRSKYVPSIFYVKIKDDFIKTIPYIDIFIRKDILQRTLDKSVLSEKDKKLYITNIENSSLENYTKNVNNTVDAIADEYLIPADYKRMTKGTRKSINYVTANFDTLEEVSKIGLKVAINNIVDLARTGTYDEQRTISKLNHLDDKLIPKDYNRLLQKDFYSAIKKSDTFLLKKDVEKVLYDFKMPKEKLLKHKKNLDNSSSYDYRKNIDEIKEDILDIDNYSDTVQKFYNNISLKELQKSKNIIIFFQNQLAKIKYLAYIYFFFNTVAFTGTLLLASEFIWLLPLALIISTYLYDLGVQSIDSIPKKYLTKNMKLSVESKMFSTEILNTVRTYRKRTLLFALIIAIYSFIT